MTKKTVGVQDVNYIYDVENRMLPVENSAGFVIAEYYYDPFGRRLWKDVDGVRTYFFYSDEGLIVDYWRKANCSNNMDSNSFFHKSNTWYTKCSILASFFST